MQKSSNNFFKYFLLSLSILFCFSDFEILPAVQSGNLDILRLLLEARADKNLVINIGSDGSKFTVLGVAASSGHLNIIVYYKDVLQFSDINPKNNNGQTPLYYAVLRGHLNVTEYYIKNGYKASSKVSPLYILWTMEKL